jgi:hypothetical protein
MNEFEIDNNLLNGSIYSKIGSFIKYKSFYLYLVKLTCIDKNTNQIINCVKIGITNDDPIIRFKSFKDEFIPIPIKYKVLFISNLFDTRNKELESLFKKNNEKMKLNIIMNRSKKNSFSTEIYPYNEAMMHSFYTFFESIKYNLSNNYYIDENDKFFKYIYEYKYKLNNLFLDNCKKRNIKDEELESDQKNICLNKRMKNIDINNINILSCPDTIPSISLEGKNCALYFNDKENKMVGWYKATIKEINLQRKHKNNCSFLVEYGKDTFVHFEIISKNNYGVDKLWILLE